MAEGNTGIKGISIGVTADASQVKRVFNEAIQGFEGKTIAITLTAKEDKTFAQRFAALRNQKVEIPVSLMPTRQSIRDFRKDFNERIAKEGGVRAQIKVKGISQAEGKTIRGDIVASIGKPVVEVLLNWKWGPGGPPPTQFMGGGGGGGGGGPEAAGPVMRPVPVGGTAFSQADLNAFIRQEVGRRLGAATGSAGTGTGTFQRAPRLTPTQKQEAEDAPVAAAVVARTPRAQRQPHRYDRKAGEDEAAYMERLSSTRERELTKLTSKSEQVRSRANNALVQLEKRLQIDEGRAYIPPAGRGIVSRQGNVTTLTPANQGARPLRTDEGKLLSDVLHDLQRSGAVGRGSVAEQRGALQKEFGVEVGPSGVKDLGKLGALAGSVESQNALIARINQRVLDTDQPERARAPGRESIEGDLAAHRRARDDLLAGAQRSTLPTGVVQPAGALADEQRLIDRRVARLRASPRFKGIEAGIGELEARLGSLGAASEGFVGGGKAARSLASERGRGINRIQEVAAPGPSEHINVGRIQSGAFLQAFIDEVTDEVVRRPDFRSDKPEMAAFRQRWAQTEPGERESGLWGTGFQRAQQFAQQGQPIKALFGERRFNEQTGGFDIVPAGEKLPSGEESTGFEGALPARAALFAQARGGKLPGVGKAAVRYAMAPTRDDIPSGKLTEAGLNFISKIDALTAVINEVYETRRGEEATAKRSAAGQQGAETKAEALNPPVRQIIPAPEIAERGRVPGSRGRLRRETEAEYGTRATAAMEEHSTRQAEADATFQRAQEKFAARVKTRDTGRAARASTAAGIEAERLRGDPMLRQFQASEAAVAQARQGVAGARTSRTPRTDPELAAYLARQRGGRGPSNLERLRTVAGRAAGATDEDVPKVLESAKLVGKPPASFDPLHGALIRIGQSFTGLPTRLSNPEQGRKEITQLTQRLSRTPEELATTETGPANPERIAEAETTLREARIQRVQVGRARLRARTAAQAPEGPVGAEPVAPTQELPDLSDLGISQEQIVAAFQEAIPQQMAAGSVVSPPVPPGAVAGHGGLGGGGGVVPVRVTNFSELAGKATTQGAQAASTVAAAGGYKETSLAETLGDTPKVPPGMVRDEKGKLVTAPKLGAAVPTFAASDPRLQRAYAASQSAEAMLAARRKTPGADLERPLALAAGRFQRLADMLTSRAGPQAGVGAGERAEVLREERGQVAAAKPKPSATEKIAGPRGSARSVLGELVRSGALPREEAESILGTKQATGLGAEETPEMRGLAEGREMLAMSRQGLPIRAFPQTIAQLAAGPTRGKTTARFAQAEKFFTQAGALEPRREELSDTLIGQQKSLINLNNLEKEGVELTKEQKKQHASLPGEIKKTEKALAGVASQQGKLVVEGAKLAKLTGMEKMANLGKSLVGSVGGTLAYGAALGVAAGATAALGVAIAPVLERAMGYKNTTAALTNELAEQIKTTGQSTDATVNQKLALANLNKESAARISNVLGERAEVMASNQQLQQHTELYGSALEIQRQNREGLGARGGGRTRYGDDINLYESTGGFFNTSFMAPGPSTQEALAHEFELGRQALEQAGSGAPGYGTYGGTYGGRYAGGIGQTATSPATTQVPENLKDFEGSLKAANENLSLFVATTDEGKKQVEVFAQALDDADMQSWASAVRTGLQTGHAVGVQGWESMTPDQRAKIITTAATNYQRGVAQRDPAQVIEGMKDQISAAVQLSFEQARIERKLQIPTQRDIANLAAPIVPFSEVSLMGAPGGAGPRTGVMPGARGAVQRAQQSTIEAQQLATANEAEAMTAYDELFKPLGDSAKQEFMAVRQQIQTTGRELADLGNEQVTIQVNLQTEQFDEQLRQVRRSLADARELTTGVDAPGNTDDLGLLNRTALMQSRQSAQLGFQQQALGLQSQQLQLQNTLLGRKSQMLGFQSTELSFQSKQLQFQSTALSLAQNQRQINFQVATAGFTAPGLTGEERAARIAEADKEAEYAQKQQDIAVQQFGLEKQAFGIELSQYAIAKAQFELDAQQIAIQQQSLAISQQQYALGIQTWQTQQAIIDAQNARAVEDLEIQEHLVEAAKTATQAMQANEKTITNLQRKLDKLQQQAGSYLGQATTVATAIAQAGASLVAQFGGDLNTMLTAYERVWIRFRADMTGDTSGLIGVGSTRYDSTSGKVEGIPKAEGAVGMFTAPTKLIVGDAGGEMVAILRNPKPIATGMLGGGGGGMQIYMPVTITGNTIAANDERELKAMADRLTRLVEQRLGKRASMFGFRSADR